MFARRNQDHSCLQRSVEDHLAAASDSVRATFDRLAQVVAELGPYTTVPVKSQVNFRSRTNFMAVKVRSDKLIVEVVLPERNPGPKFTKVNALGATAFAHTAELTRPEDIDDELVEVLATSYALGSRER
jgi:hypothetical protein